MNDTMTACKNGVSAGDGDGKMTENRKLANEIREWLLKNEMWIDTIIYFDGKAYAPWDKKGNFYYNDREHLIEYESDPKDYFEYVGNPHILSMSFEGPLYDLINYDFSHPLLKEFDSIFEKHGLVYELGDAWNLTCYRL